MQEHRKRFGLLRPNEGSRAELNFYVYLGVRPGGASVFQLKFTSADPPRDIQINRVLTNI